MFLLRARQSVSQMTVTPHDRNSFLVQSQSCRPPHLVDMEENSIRGWCSCEDWEFRVQPKRERCMPTRICKHARAVLKHMLDWLDKHMPTQLSESVRAAIKSMLVCVLLVATGCGESLQSKQRDRIARLSFAAGALAMAHAIKENSEVANMSGDQAIEAAKNYWRREYGSAYPLNEP